MKLRWAKIHILDRSVLGEELLVVFKIFKCSFKFYKILTETWPFRERDGNCHVLPDSRWEMLLKAVEQRRAFLKVYRKALGNAQRLLGSPWEIIKG
jgi:hypothetical protein